MHETAPACTPDIAESVTLRLALGAAPVGPDQPLTVAVSATPVSPKAGGKVTFRVTVDDPDGAQFVSRDVGTVDYGDGTPADSVFGHRDCVGAYGPWTPTPPEPIHAELTFEHVYAAAGTYTARSRSGRWGTAHRGRARGPVA